MDITVEKGMYRSALKRSTKQCAQGSSTPKWVEAMLRHGYDGAREM